MSETAQKQTHGFQAEVKQLLQLMIHSLYSNKEIFLRELVSNASDAADKLRFLALSDASLYGDDGELRVRLSLDKEAKTITISDNGIGMTEQEVIDNLGTIAKSGTKEFFSQLSGDQNKDANLIGQFGVGFYSAFIVADKVTVRTLKAGAAAEQAVEWESTGEGEYSLATVKKEQRGTDIILHLRDDEHEFLEEYKVKSIITKYSDHISIPVEMWQDEQPEQKGETEEDTIAAVPGHWQAINKATALWTRDKSDISDEEYQEFYKHISHDWTEPMSWSHNKVEGTNNYTSLLYIPKKAPFDLWNRDAQHGLKLYVQRVFIMDDAEEFMPSYLRFFKGLLDSSDLPLNVSREILQDTKVTQSLRKGCTNRALKMLEKLAKDGDSYQAFWNEFGQVLKEGPAEDFANKDKIAGLLRFASTHNDDASQNVSLSDYLGRMKEGQDEIFFLVADNYAAAKHSPHLEVFRKKGIEVLLLSDRIDEWLMQHLTEFEQKKLRSVAKGGLDLSKLDDDADKEAHKASEEAFASTIERFKAALGEQVKDVKVSHRLTDSPACVVTDEHDMSTQMMKLMESVGQTIPEVKPIFEVNPDHLLVKHVADEQDESRFKEWAEVLLEQALLAERGSLKNPATFVGRLNQLLLSLTK
ncbi:molecular chaperone HtpG [Alkalimonas collagenimarina]|uniref:Chaperone protein HtpG n=1 Tax=Alkalimonas collagenimarina TaxID=400390 RepID=A0ABT9GV78_9GAMM|nr:molecular chaperone HtpG [Alkalimonas collagenimarina]MDP4534957.1 molecular chaperone HtpG [Alkalimonas collagenimarina]